MRRRQKAAISVWAACAVVAASACAPSGGVEGAPDTAPSTVARSTPGPTPPPSPTSLPSRPDHVVIVVLENKDVGDVLDNAPYLAGLASSGASLTDMHAETHPSQPNYIALFSGATHGITDDSCPHTIDAPNLASEVAAAGFTFAGYAEDLPTIGFTGCQAGGYARKHSPWTNFSNVPATASQPLSAMPSDYAALPTVSFLIPNLCHDMHDCSVAEADTWLRQHLDGYAQWARIHNSLLLVTFDESESSEGDNQIATIATGQRVVPGRYPQRLNHYNLLRTLEDLYGLAHLGHSADATAVTQLWNAGSG